MLLDDKKRPKKLWRAFYITSNRSCCNLRVDERDLCPCSRSATPSENFCTTTLRTPSRPAFSAYLGASLTSNLACWALIVDRSPSCSSFRLANSCCDFSLWSLSFQWAWSNAWMLAEETGLENQRGLAEAVYLCLRPFLQVNTGLFICYFTSLENQLQVFYFPTASCSKIKKASLDASS